MTNEIGSWTPNDKGEKPKVYPDAPSPALLRVPPSWVLLYRFDFPENAHEIPRPVLPYAVERKPELAAVL